MSESELKYVFSELTAGIQTQHKYPEMLPSLLQERGIFPAYHMSKTHWVTVALDGTEPGASEDMAAFLTEVSFTLTAKKTKK